jgi:hypothetical protein
VITKTGPRDTTVEGTPARMANGAALAAILGAGVGAFSMGLVVLLNEAGAIAAPTLYAPVGGLSGRTTLGAASWLIAWAVLHRRWRGREVQPRGLFVATLVLIALGVIGTFPPVWGLFD